MPLTPHTVNDMDALRAILVHVRRQGYAATDQELEEGLRSLAVPLRNASGTVTAALNLSVHASRASMASLRRDFLPMALRTAAAIEEDLRGTAPAIGTAARTRSRSPDGNRSVLVATDRDRSRPSRFANRRRGENQSVADAVRP